MTHAARLVAGFAHAGQLDKCLVPYFEHVRWVGERAAEIAPADLKADCEAAGFLHDVVEDTPMSLQELRELGFSADVVDAVGHLTHTHMHTHAEYIRRLRDAPGRPGKIARIVKRADLEHNSLPERDYTGRGKLTERYERAQRILDGVEP